MQQGKSSQPVVGVMSGTSLDGVDIALCLFGQESGKYTYQFLQAETIPLPVEWLRLLSDPFSLTGEQLASAHVAFGKFLGEEVKQFLRRHQTRVSLIASHGHTLYHQPGKGFTFQLGHGAAIAHAAGVDTVCDFRTGDVVLGGQGAPLVPIGDELLFGEYDACLNLGGFANISCRNFQNRRIGFDISPCNFVLNHLAQRAGYEYDGGGKMAASGQCIPQLLETLNALDYYSADTPKSLGAEWVHQFIYPLIMGEEFLLNDLLNTVTEHIAIQIGHVLRRENIHSLLITGGGAKNTYLTERIQKHVDGKVTIPDPKTIDYKEALIFAFLGYLRSAEKVNVLSSVTGASMDSCAGAIYKAFPSVGY